MRHQVSKDLRAYRFTTTLILQKNENSESIIPSDN